MKTIKVNKLKLMGILESNLAQHENDYKEAQEQYLVALKKELQEMLQQVESGEMIDRVINAVEPVTYADSYRLAIDMLDMSVDAEVELDAQEFKRYVRDEWEWKNSFLSNTLVYKSE
jgi:hypothetical protein